MTHLTHSEKSSIECGIAEGRTEYLWGKSSFTLEENTAVVTGLSRVDAEEHVAKIKVNVRACGHVGMWAGGRGMRDSSGSDSSGSDSSCNDISGSDSSDSDSSGNDSSGSDSSGSDSSDSDSSGSNSSGSDSSGGDSSGRDSSGSDSSGSDSSGNDSSGSDSSGSDSSGVGFVCMCVWGGGGGGGRVLCFLAGVHMLYCVGTVIIVLRVPGLESAQ